MDPPGRDTFGERYRNFAARFPQTQQLIDLWRSENPGHSDRAPDSDTDFDNFLTEIGIAGPENQLSEQLNNHQIAGTSSDNQPSSFSSPGLSYLRNFITSQSHSGVSRAWEELQREVETRNVHSRPLQQALGQNPGRFDFEQARAAVDRRIHRLQQMRSDAQDSRRSFHDQLAFLSAVDASGEFGAPSLRTNRRRSLHPSPHDLLHHTLPPTPALMPQRSPNGRGRVKRRKLDADDNREGTGGFNYGHHGQVVPGPLKMEIAGCDGGIDALDGKGATPDSILRNDHSVYCTKSDRYNLILQHRGEAPFCLKKLVIKTPGIGFDSPYVFISTQNLKKFSAVTNKRLSIQEGMIFVAMDSDDSLARTAQYHIQYSNPRRHRHRSSRRPYITPSMEYLTGFRSPLQSLERTVLIDPESQDARVAGPASGESSGSQAAFRVTIDDKDTGEENLFVNRAGDDLPSVSEAERAQPEDDPLCSDSDDESPTDDEEDEESTMSTFNSRRRQEMRRQLVTGIRRTNSDSSQRRRQYPSLVDPLPQSSSTPSDSGVLKPHARFFIEKEKSMVSIKFDPPP